MDYKEIRNKFLDFFKKHNHFVLPDASLIPKDDDPSALFTNSGMHPIKNFFTGKDIPPAKKLCSVQKCVRTIDIDKVGHNGRTLTFFFMLGNWSIGDYWKKETAEYGFDLLVNGYKFDKERLWVSVFAGDEKRKLPKDNEAIEAWGKWISKKRIVELSFEDNFWQAGDTGPCGPCAEVYYDRGKEFGCGIESCKPGCDCDRFLEIWNCGVFMQYYHNKDGSFEKLLFNSVDTGAGLERLCCLLEKKESVFETSLFKPIMDLIDKFSNNSTDIKAKRIIADHTRTAVFIIADGIEPAKIGRGYVLRRMLRRLIKYGQQIGLKRTDFNKLIDAAIGMYEEDYPHLKKTKNKILTVFDSEYDKFIKTLENGNKKLKEIIYRLQKEQSHKISGDDVFHLYDTYGFPMELTKEIAEENHISIDEAGYKKSFEKHQDLSRSSADAVFKGGLVDHSQESTMLHTATHLLHQALREVLGKAVMQKGSNITPERLRFDFSLDRKMTQEEINKVENIVNEKIKEELPIHKEEMSPADAKQSGAIGLFDAKYGNTVSVYSIGGFSREICMGPHVQNTSTLGQFKIQKEEASAAGVRRIKAILI